jgi:hypothetical protein
MATGLQLFGGRQEAGSTIEGVFLMATAAKAALHIFISPSRFRDLVDEGVITRQPTGGYNFDVVREQYIRNAQRVMQGRGADGGEALSAKRARLADAQASAAEFKNAQAQGNFVELSLMKQMLEQTFLVMREIALGTAGKVADSLQPFTPLDRTEIYRVIHAEICTMLESLADPHGLACQAADKVVGSKGSRR